MNKNYLIKTLTVFVGAFCLLSCTDDTPHGPNIPIEPEPEPEPVEAVDITTIYELNNGEYPTNSHSDVWANSMLEYDYTSLVKVGYPGEAQLSSYYPIYPRIKKMHNGKYIMFYEHSNFSSSIYYALSDDLKTWDDKGYIFEQSTTLYKSADAIVLSNGDVLIFTTTRNPNSILMRRSTDNGLSWSAPQLVYDGDNWEPYALQLAPKEGETVGELQVYFTCSDTARGDSGTALLRSMDNGVTWDASKGKIIRQISGTNADDGLPIYTDQMPVAVELNDGAGIAVALESRFGSKYNVSMAYSTDNWAAPLTEAESDPESRTSNLFTDCVAPYLVQFPSGETILSYATNKKFYYMRFGNAKARLFDKSDPILAVPDKGGCWGSTMLDSSHVIAAVFPGGYDYTDDQRGSYVQIAKYVLNHRINATGLAPTIDGNNKEWKSVTDALFLGSESPVQTVFRFGYADDYLYVLVERLDDDVTDDDTIELMFQSGDATGTPFVLTLTPDVKNSTVKCSNTVIACRSTLNNDPEATVRRGYLVEMAINRSMLSVAQERILFNAVMHDGETVDTFSRLDETNYNLWLPIEFKKATTPEPDPEPGDNDNTGNGPGWGLDDNEFNPW